MTQDKIDIVGSGLMVVVIRSLSAEGQIGQAADLDQEIGVRATLSWIMAFLTLFEWLKSMSAIMFT